MDRLDPLSRALATNAVSTAEQIAARYAKVFPRYADDIQSSAYWGAVRAATEYDKARSETTKWNYWSKFRITNEVKDFLRSTWVERAARPRDDWDEAIADPSADKAIEDVDTRDEYERLLLYLTPEQQRLLDAVRENDGSVEAAAASCDITYDCARVYYSRAVRKLRQECTV